MIVLIKGMEMPKSCVTCRWHERWGCGLTGIGTNTAEGCPLVSIPTPHGRLIDADALRYEIEKYFAGLPIQGRYDMLKMVDEAPTIIEAEEGEA